MDRFKAENFLEHMAPGTSRPLALQLTTREQSQRDGKVHPLAESGERAESEKGQDLPSFNLRA